MGLRTHRLQIVDITISTRRYSLSPELPSVFLAHAGYETPSAQFAANPQTHKPIDAGARRRQHLFLWGPAAPWPPSSYPFNLPQRQRSRPSRTYLRTTARRSGIWPAI